MGFLFLFIKPLLYILDTNLSQLHVLQTNNNSDPWGKLPEAENMH